MRAVPTTPSIVQLCGSFNSTSSFLSLVLLEPLGGNLELLHLFHRLTVVALPTRYLSLVLKPREKRKELILKIPHLIMNRSYYGTTSGKLLLQWWDSRRHLLELPQQYYLLNLRPTRHLAMCRYEFLRCAECFFVLVTN